MRNTHHSIVLFCKKNDINNYFIIYFFTKKLIFLIFLWSISIISSIIITTDIDEEKQHQKTTKNNNIIQKPYDQLVNEGLNGQSSVRELPYIGPFFEGRLRRLGFLTVNDLVLHFNRKSAPEIYDGLTRLLLILDTLTTPGPETSVAN